MRTPSRPESIPSCAGPDRPASGRGPAVQRAAGGSRAQPEHCRTIGAMAAARSATVARWVIEHGDHVAARPTWAPSTRPARTVARACRPRGPRAPEGPPDHPTRTGPGRPAGRPPPRRSAPRWRPGLAADHSLATSTTDPAAATVSSAAAMPGRFTGRRPPCRARRPGTHPRRPPGACRTWCGPRGGPGRTWPGRGRGTPWPWPG